MKDSIQYTKNPRASDTDFLTHKINQETTQYGQATPFAFFMRDEDQCIIAGANGFVMYGTVYTDQLWVHKKYRGQGIARKIMNKVHNLGRRSGCMMAAVQTMSFQNTIAFYEKLGYIQDFKRAGYAGGSTLVCMKKIL